MNDFDTATAAHRRELHIHCYRLLANFDEAEDAVQDTMTRAWQARERFDGQNLRAWLYRIATNACLDRMRQAKALERSYAEISWLSPYPDALLDEPADLAVARETIELAFLALIQLLPPRQRAALVLRDVLEWSAAETAEALEMSVPAVNSALQRARATIAENPRNALRTHTPNPDEQRLLAGFIDAHERLDPDAAVALVRDDLDITMPPHPMHLTGKAEMQRLYAHAQEMGEWRLRISPANRMPCAASYLRRPGDDTFRAMKFDVLTVRDGLIAATTTFGPELFGAFGLAPTLNPAPAS